jgi:hypothetical protein
MSARCVVWDEAAKWLKKFPDAVLTMTDADGYPASVRVGTRNYDAATGELAAPIPSALTPVAGPANLMCHSHDEKLWSLQMIVIKGRVESRDSSWIFVSESFDAPSRAAVVLFVRTLRRSAQRYLDKRGLSRPEVNWAAVKQVQQRAKL